ncbi:MAG TPA: chemotaxis protein CheW [Thermoanaerobaculia bacterium]
MTLRFIAFRVGTETFLIDIMAVRQVVMHSGVAHVPTAPAFIEGVMVLRSEVIPVIDVRVRINPQRQSGTDQPLIVLTQTPAGVVGLKVDEVRRLVTVNSEELMPAPAMVRGVRGEFLVAIAQQGEEIFLVLDINSLLTSDEQRELRTATLS